MIDAAAPAASLDGSFDRELARLNRRTYARARRLLADTVTRGVAAGAFRRAAPDVKGNQP